MRGLTLTAPWIPAAILAPAHLRPKRIENRTTRPPECIRGKRFALHQGKTFDEEAAAWIKATLPGAFQLPVGWWDSVLRTQNGTILATAVCVGWIEFEDSRSTCPWTLFRFVEGRGLDQGFHITFPFPGQERWWVKRPGNFAWVLEDVRAVKTPIPCRGAQGPWVVPDAVEARLVAEGLA